MKKIFLILFILFLLIVLGIMAFLGFLGYIPGLSKIMGAQTPRDLGVTYTEADHTSAREKSQIKYSELPANTPVEKSVVRSGTREITDSCNSAELTSLMNNRPYKYWPIENVQIKINDDGTTEFSGLVVREKLTGYAAGIGVPQNVIDVAGKLLPANASFYVKSKTSLKNNKVEDFEIESVYLGKIAIPVETLLGQNSFVGKAFAADSLTSELSKYSGKKQAIIDFINNRLTQINGFYAKEAYFDNSKLYFEGTLPKEEKTLR